jgi:hypothetical protein
LKKLLIAGAGIIVTFSILVIILRSRNAAAPEEKNNSAAQAPVSEDPFEWLAAGGPVDEAVQEEYWAWQSEVARAPSARWWAQRRSWQAWAMGQTAAPPARLIELLRELEGQGKKLRILLAHKSLRIGTGGWARRDKEAGKSLTQVRGPNLHVSRWGAYYFGYSAMLSPDPGPDLTNLDRLFQAHLAARVSFDVEAARSVHNIRDEIYFQLALQNRLPANAQASWLREQHPYFKWAADYVHGELLFYSYLRHRLMHRFDQTETDARAEALSPRLLFDWFFGPPDVTPHIDYLNRMEGWIQNRTGSIPLPKRTAGSSAAWRRRIPMPDSRRVLSESLNTATRHRLTTLAVKAIAMARRMRRLPAGEPEFTTWLNEPQALAPGGDRLKLRYEKLSESSFRLTVDPDTPLPLYYTVRRYRSLLNRPASKPFWQSNDDWNLELEVPP